MRLIDRDEVHARLTYEVCIPLVRAAMIALSRGETRQLLRSIIPLGDGRMFGIMPGAMGDRSVFGAKLISVFPENFAKNIQSHQGVVVLFDGESGAPVCVAHAGEITAIRTAAASAVATDALARPDAHRLALLGYGEQALTHARAIRQFRALSAITVWGRSPERARAFAARLEAETGLEVTACVTAQAAVAQADIVCTVTGAAEPIVSYENFLRVQREGVLAQGAEFLRAKAAGLVDDTHVVGEIGQVLDGALQGRQSKDQITVYKSLGHIVQDLAAAQALFASET